MWTKKAAMVTDQSSLSIISLQVGSMDMMKGGVSVNSENRLVVVKSVRHLRMVQFQCVLCFVYCTAMLANICFGGLTLIGKLQGFGFFCVYLMGSVLRWDIKLENCLFQILNTFVQFEKDVIDDFFPDRPHNYGLKLLKILVFISEVSIRAIPTFQFALLTYAPCTPPFILSMLPACNEMTDAGDWSVTLVALLVHIFELWMSLHIVSAGGIVLIYVFLLGIVCILSYIRILERLVKKTHNFKYQLVEGALGRAGSQVTKTGHVLAQNTCEMLYRKIQVLEKSVNAYLSERILPAIIICLPAIQIVALFVCINLHGEIKMPGFIVFPILWIDTMWGNAICFSLASLVQAGRWPIQPCW
ncbi:hypothetical protein Fcan01_00083 [Folsomia candida]|uniref:Uncharacterized protein n=1 Tax=Folsomia candida TaxID=158441 RepID=A0A226EWJ1_FOLCA|nr:hypothetical protein Fcan01_00083 [Folsomia candida]